EGIVVDVKIFSRKGVEKDERARQIEDAELFMMEKNLKDEIRILQDERDKRIEDLLDGTTATADLVNLRGEKLVKKGQKLTLETHLGWAAKALGLHFATPVFDGATEKEIKGLLADANQRETERNPLRPNQLEHGKMTLIDGMTGEAFEQKVSVGYIYMLKLSH